MPFAGASTSRARRRGAASRRLQRRRAEARRVASLLNDVQALLSHRGGQPSRLQSALATALGWQGHGPAAAHGADGEEAEVPATSPNIRKRKKWVPKKVATTPPEAAKEDQNMDPQKATDEQQSVPQNAIEEVPTVQSHEPQESQDEHEEIQEAAHKSDEQQEGAPATKKKRVTFQDAGDPLQDENEDMQAPVQEVQEDSSDDDDDEDSSDHDDDDFDTFVRKQAKRTFVDLDKDLREMRLTVSRISTRLRAARSRNDTDEADSQKNSMDQGLGFVRNLTAIIEYKKKEGHLS